AALAELRPVQPEPRLLAGGQLPADVEAETRPRLLRIALLVDPEEALEDACGQRRRDAAALVLDLDRRAFLPPPHAHPHPCRAAAVGQGVVDQVVEYAGQVVAVGLHAQAVDSVAREIRGPPLRARPR